MESHAAGWRLLSKVRDHCQVPEATVKDQALSGARGDGGSAHHLKHGQGQDDGSTV